MRRSVLAAILFIACVATGVVWWLVRDGVEIRKVEFHSGGYKLVGDLYIPREARSRSALLLIHGSTVYGRRLLLYPELCRRLCRDGYVVCNLDQRGHGDSEGPQPVRVLADLDFVGDARAVARDLPSVAGAGIRDVVLIGHSFGGGVAAIAGMEEPSVRAVVSMGPGRRIAERYPVDDFEKLEYVQKRKSADMKLANPIPLGLVHPMLATYDIGQLKGKTLSKPLVIIEGELEPAEDLEFTRRLVATMSGNVKHVIIPGADHFFGTAETGQGQDKRWKVVARGTLEKLAQVVEDQGF